MEKIALLPGGFKPPHAGHYNMAKWLANNTDADTVVIKVGAKERDGITREISLKLWNLYRLSDPDSPRIAILPSNSNSPVTDVYDFIEKEAPEGSIVYLGMGEKDATSKRFANIGKFAEPKDIKFKITLVPPQDGGISGSDMRDFIKNGDKESFQKYIPKHLTQEQKDQAWEMVSSLEEMMYGTMTKQEKAKHAKNLKRLKKDMSKQGDQYEKVPDYLKGTLTRKYYNEDLYSPEDKVLDYMRSSEYKAGLPDGSKEDIPHSYKYKRGGVYGRMYEEKFAHHSTSAAKIDDIIIPLEIADTPEKQIRGMMGRDEMDGGMIFPYDQISQKDFHMEGCKIPLDIIFIKGEKINKIHHNCPPCKQTPCPKYSGIADNVLELPGGYCKKHNIKTGDEINLNLAPVDDKPIYSLKERDLSAEEERII